VPRLGGLGCHDAREIKLRNLHFRINERFLYEYDFGDLWQHQVRIGNRAQPVLSGVRGRSMGRATGGLRGTASVSGSARGRAVASFFRRAGAHQSPLSGYEVRAPASRRVK
jgi:Plasmid pRiA4b ORF-3-like protein